MFANAPEVMGLATNVGFKQRILVDAANAVAVAGGRIVSGHNRSYGGMNMYDQPLLYHHCIITMWYCHVLSMKMVGGSVLG